ncbi:alpha-ketoacid dehydrogenase subunit beta [Isoptericola variabilis]|uniref:alpha-ketoacid dehydrogenase subunit beta n=1 Tax=Isoptericola variabilis TaxID=139208 RepID=UPI003D237848
MTTQTLTLAKSLGAGLRRAMTDDPTVMALGEDIGRLGGVYRVTDGLQAEFGPRRVVDTPLAESGILGTAVGLAYRGYRPVVEIQFDGFVYVAFDQIVSQLAKMHARTHGAVKLPVTIRIPVAGGIGAAEHHSESPEAYFVHTAGLRVVSVSNPQDASTVLRQAIACDDPVVFFEPKRLYHVKGEVDADLPLADAPPMAAARVVRPGDDVTLVTFGSHVATALDAATAASDEGVSVEVVDLRSLSPIDHDTIAASVRRTGRLVVLHEGPRQAGVGAEIATSVTERCFDFLEAPPVRVTGYDIPYPPAKLEGNQVPDLDRVLVGIDRVLGRADVGSGVVSGLEVGA